MYPYVKNAHQNSSAHRFVQKRKQSHDNGMYKMNVNQKKTIFDIMYI